MATEAYIDGNKINDARPLAQMRSAALPLLGWLPRSRRWWRDTDQLAFGRHPGGADHRELARVVGPLGAARESVAQAVEAATWLSSRPTR